MGKNRITIHDVAAKAGVAISSVSRVISGHRDVSAKMRAKVEAAVAELGYEPDHLAQSLRKGATMTIGFLIRDITNPLFSIVAQSAEYELRKAGYSIILINSHGDLDAEKENFALFKRRRIDGVIASLVSEDSPYVRNTINELGAPVVLLDREVTGLNASAVICDHAQGVKQATADLIANGYQRIAFVSGRKDVFISRNRIKGYEQALADAKIKIDEDLIRLGKFGEEFFALNPFKSGLNTPILRFNGNDLWVVITGWTLVAFIVFFMWIMVNSPWGRLMRAIREDEDAVRSLGKNVYLYKMQSLIIGGVIGACGGFVYALSRQSVQPDNYGTALTFFAYTVLILGGAARVFSPVVGAMIFWFLIVFIEQVLRQGVTNDLIPDWLIGANQVSQIRFMLMGIGLMLLMIFRPQGIFGDKKELALDAKA